MGFISRLKSAISSPPPPAPARDRTHRGPSLQLQDVRSMIEAAPGLSQPVWGPEISTVGAYSREGYTSKTFDKPVIPFRIQANILQIDEDVQLAVNHLASKVTGGQHYVQAINDDLQEHFAAFTKRMNFDIFDTIMIKEALWYGNSVWKPRMGIRQVNSFDDLMHIPISSFVRIWWDRQRIPYKYEFRGAEYQGYHNPDEIIHFKWNPVDASAFGTGLGVSLTSPRIFEMVTSGGVETVELAPMVERKYATQRNMQFAEQRYISHNVWTVEGGSEDDRQNLQSQIENLEVGQDVVAGTKVEVQELGSQAKNFNADQFMDITLGPMMKALNDFRGKESGTSQHTYANAAESAVLDEIGLAAFPIAILQQLEDKIIKPWYDAHPYVQMSYLGGMIPVPFEQTEFTLNFGEVEKQDLPVESHIKLLELWMDSPIKKSPVEIRTLFEQAGLGLIKKYSHVMDYEMDPELTIEGGSSKGGDDLNFSNNGGDPDNKDKNQENNYGKETVPNMLLPQRDIGGGPIPPFPDFSSGTTSPPMDMEVYNAMMQDVRGPQPGDQNAAINSDLQNSYKRGNQSQFWKQGEYVG